MKNGFHCSFSFLILLLQKVAFISFDVPAPPISRGIKFKVSHKFQVFADLPAASTRTVAHLLIFEVVPRKSSVSSFF